MVKYKYEKSENNFQGEIERCGEKSRLKWQNERDKMSKVCVFFAPGYEEIEALAVVDLLRRAGIETDMVSITKERQATSSHGITVQMDKLFSEVDFQEVDMIVLPGGMPGTKNLEAFEPLMEMVDSFYAEKKLLGAICAAPSIFGHKGMLKGRKACCFPEFESHLEGAEVTKNPVESSDFIITGRGMGCAVDFGLAIVEKFQGKDAAAKLAEKVVYGHYK